MASNVENAFIAHSIDAGVFFSAPAGTTVPTDATSPLDPALKDHGTIGEDGLAVGITRTSKDIKDFDGATFVDIQDEYNGTIKLTFLESDHEEVCRTLFGDAKVVTTGTDIHISHSPDQLPIKTYVVQAKSGDKRKRYVIEKGRVSEIAETKDVYNDITKHEATIKSFRNSNGNYIEEYRSTAAAPVVKTVTVGSGVTAFTLSVNGNATSSISYTSGSTPASALQSALNALSGVTATVTGSAGGPYTVTLTSGGTLTASGTGGSVTVA